jgi:hypothetical protein
MTLLFFVVIVLKRARGNIVSITTGYGLDDRGAGVRVPVGSRISTTLYRSDRILGPPKFLSSGYRGGGEVESFHGVKAAGT